MEDCLDEIVAGIRRFYDEKVSSPLRRVAQVTS
jgi:hypothetical protein